MNKEVLWEFKYRPRSVGDCILPDRIKRIFKDYVKDGVIPNLILQGPPGVGKTSVILAACEDIGCDYLFINGASENGVDVIRDKFETYASSVSLNGGRKVIICDEGDRLSAHAQDALKTNIERFSNNCSLVITSNHKYRLIDAIQSRCPDIDFTLRGPEKPQMAKEIYQKTSQILEKEGVVFKKEVLVEIIKKNFPDFRRIINRLQMYSRLGDIDVGILSGGINNLIDITSKLKDKDFNGLRKLVATQDIDYSTIYRNLYDQLYDIMEPQSIPPAVLILADYQYKQSMAVDYDINFMACLTELMGDCKFL